MWYDRLQPRDSVRRFARARRLIAGQVIKPPPRMGVDHAEALVLFLQVREQRHQCQMLDDIGEIAGVIGVAIVHLRGNRRGRRNNSPPQLGQRVPIVSVQAVQKVHS